MKYLIKVSFMTNKSYPQWKKVLVDAVVREESIDNPYKLEDDIKEQFDFAKGEYITELEWDYSNAKEVK